MIASTPLEVSTSTLTKVGTFLALSRIRTNLILVYNHVLKLDLGTLQWELVDNYGDIPGVRMGNHSLFPFARHTYLVRSALI